ncbi:hypothetical protein HKCCA1058_05910 [Rhodobacterales bacterium HKCCA1058]|nr:hypothetical protein [Rhodobacterales bacterium HKCCA1058]
MSFKKYNKYIKKLPEVYQPITLGQTVIAAGKRDNAYERYNAIKQYFKDGQTILDVGSNAGFFSIELAKDFPNSLIVSVEGNIHYAKIQRELIIDQKINNIVLVNSYLDIDWIERARDACVFFDNILLLSVIHHFPDPKNVMRKLSSISRAMLMEMPDPNEKNVCGKHRIKDLDFDFISDLKKNFQELDYKSEVHTDESIRRNYYYVNDNEYKRVSYYPYIGYPLDKREYNISSDENGTKIYKKHLNENINLVPGVNYIDINNLGEILHPTTSQIIKSFHQSVAEKSAEGVELSDIRPWNILLTPRGAQIIDYRYTPDLDPKLKMHYKRDFMIFLRYLFLHKFYWKVIKRFNRFIWGKK